MRKVVLRALAGIIACGIPVAAGAQIYSQPYDGSGTVGLFASQTDTSGGFGSFATVYDNFTFASDAQITGVSFTGGYFNGAGAGTTTAFELQFYADAAGAPGASLFSAVIGGNGSESCDASLICTYDLLTNFAASAGTQYWISLVSQSDFPPQWGWASGSGGDGVYYQDFFGQRTQYAGDRAFTLNGLITGVPEPSTWAMMLLGFGALGFSIRRSSKPVLAKAA